jgi:hypothetical protein
MALTDNESMVMPVSPMYGGNGGGFGNGFGGDWAWIILLLLLGWGNNGNGFGGYGGDGLYPWMNQANLTSNGFQNQLMNDNITEIRSGVSNLSTQLCNCCGDMQMALANGFAGVEQGANARQMANMQSMFGIQSSLQECCCENRAGIADLKYTVATENCADRTQAMQNTRDIIDSQTRSTQAVLDKLCQLELDGFKRENDNLRSQLNMATLRESQTAQNAFISQGFANEVDQLYNRLNNCPVPTTPVYGRTPIFTCNGQQSCGCGCGNF